MDMSVFELFFFVFLACAWPVSIRRMIKNRSTKGKSLFFSGIILLGYAFGIAHKLLYDPDIVMYVYFLVFALVATDVIVFLYTNRRYGKGAK